MSSTRRRHACSSASCSTTRPPAPPTCSAARRHGAVRRRRPARRPRRRLRRARRGAGRRRSSRCSRRTCRPTTSPGCPSWSRAPARPPTCPRAPGVEFDHHALADGEVVELGNTEIEAIATPGHALAHHAYLVTDHARGDEPWIVLTGDALLVGDAGRPDLHAHGEHTRRGDGAHALPLADRAAADAARPPRALPGPLLGLGLRPRPVGQPGLDDRLRAPPQPRAAVRLRGRVRRRAAAGHPAGARAAGRDRRRQPQPAGR